MRVRLTRPGRMTASPEVRFESGNRWTISAGTNTSDALSSTATAPFSIGAADTGTTQRAE